VIDPKDREFLYRMTDAERRESLTGAVFALMGLTLGATVFAVLALIGFARGVTVPALIFAAFALASLWIGVVGLSKTLRRIDLATWERER
jgi:hypothetical protein